MGRRQSLSSIDTITVHCTATPNGMWFTARDIDEWHKDEGYHRNMKLAPHHAPELPYIGYHYVILLSGVPELGRPWIEQGAHVGGHNPGNLGICMIGTDSYTLAMWATLREIVDDICNTASVNIKWIKGHRDFPNVNKTCPGFDVASWLAHGKLPVEGSIYDGARRRK